MLHTHEIEGKTYYSTKGIQVLFKSNGLPCASSHQNTKDKFAKLGIELIENVPAEWELTSKGISEDNLLNYLRGLKKNSLNGDAINVSNVIEKLGLRSADVLNAPVQEKQINSVVRTPKPRNSKKIAELKERVSELEIDKSNLESQVNDLVLELEITKRDYEIDLAKVKSDLSNDLAAKLELNENNLAAKWEKIKSDLEVKLNLVQSDLAKANELNEKLDKELNQVSKPKSKGSLIEWFTYSIYYTFRQLFKLAKTEPFLFAIFCLTCAILAWHGGEYYYSVMGGNKLVAYTIAGIFESAALVMTLNGYSKKRLKSFAAFSAMMMICYAWEHLEVWTDYGVLIFSMAVPFAQYSFGDKLGTKSN